MYQAKLVEVRTVRYVGADSRLANIQTGRSFRTSEHPSLHADDSDVRTFCTAGICQEGVGSPPPTQNQSVSDVRTFCIADVRLGVLTVRRLTKTD